MNTLDPVTMADWQISEAAEREMKSVQRLASEIGLHASEVLPYGHHVGKIDQARVLERLTGAPHGKYVDVTAITPTTLGEGKTTTTIGLVQGLAAIGKRVTGAIRQPSGGPTFNVKGSAAGGGLAQCIPLSDLSLGLTGDIDAVTNAHNLAMVALTSRMQHEANYGDRTLARKKLRRLDVDARTVTMGWAIDFSAQALRDVIIGLGGRMDGLMMRSRFQISVSSEVMAILAVAADVADLRARLGRMVVAYARDGSPVTTADLEVDGAMTAIMARAINPNLMQTIEGQPILVHAGPFANIAIGQSSIIADRVGLKLADYHVTESGFGADIGFEKFWNLKCRLSGLKPDCAVVVATIRALKMHGGGPRVAPGKPLDAAYTESNPALVERGAANLQAHVATVRKSGLPAVVCINHFVTDTDEEVALVRRAVEEQGAACVVSRHWRDGGAGARELAEAVAAACDEPADFRYLYPDALPLRERIERIATEVYGAAGVTFQPAAQTRLAEVESNPELAAFGACMVKTHLSLSHDPALKGRPTGWQLPVRDVMLYHGAGLAVPVAGDITLMPGTASDPAYRRIDVDAATGRVTGLH